jgi:two-component system, cell cycle sensor histidine kinase and response regulator CckA
MSATAQISLVLEDDETSRFVLRTILEHAGFQVLSSAQAADAIEVCRVHPGSISIMVSDVVLRGSGGPDTVRQIQAVQPDMAILFVSGYPLEDLENRGLVLPLAFAKNRSFLQKPFTAQSLLTAVRQLTSQAQA